LLVKSVPTEKQLIKIANCTRDGTGDFDIAIGGALLGRMVAPVYKEEDVLANLVRGYPVLISAYHDTHWVTVIGLLGDNWVVFDPDNAAFGKQEHGCFIMRPKDLKSNYQGVAIMGPR
jgi:hypothetical protein